MPSAARQLQHEPRLFRDGVCCDRLQTLPHDGCRTRQLAHHANDVQEMRRFLSPAEAADFLGGLNVRTVVRWAREGYIPAIPIGEGKRRLWRFNARDLEDWMLSRRTGTLPTAADAPTGGF